MNLKLEVNGVSTLEACMDESKVVFASMTGDAVLTVLRLLKLVVRELEDHPAAIQAEEDVYQKAVKWALRHQGIMFGPRDIQACGCASNTMEAASICYRLVGDGFAKQIEPRRLRTGRPPGPKFEVIQNPVLTQRSQQVVSGKTARRFFQTMNAMNALNQDKQ